MKELQNTSICSTASRKFDAPILVYIQEAFATGGHHREELTVEATRVSLDHAIYEVLHDRKLIMNDDVFGDEKLVDLGEFSHRCTFLEQKVAIVHAFTECARSTPQKCLLHPGVERDREEDVSHEKDLGHFPAHIEGTVATINDQSDHASEDHSQGEADGAHQERLEGACLDGAERLEIVLRKETIVLFGDVLMRKTIKGRHNSTILSVLPNCEHQEVPSAIDHGA